MEERLAICRTCPLYKEDPIGPMCNSKKYLNPKTNDVSIFPKQGYIKGCGCLLLRKTANPLNHCVVEKW